MKVQPRVIALYFVLKSTHFFNYFDTEGVTFDATHPFHIHGTDFRVVAMERIASNVTVDHIKALDANGLIQRNLIDAPIKDTVAVPDGGYTIVRFVANNPGLIYV